MCSNFLASKKGLFVPAGGHQGAAKILYLPFFCVLIVHVCIQLTWVIITSSSGLDYPLLVMTRCRRLVRATVLHGMMGTTVGTELFVLCFSSYSFLLSCLPLYVDCVQIFVMALNACQLAANLQKEVSKNINQDDREHVQ